LALQLNTGRWETLPKEEDWQLGAENTGDIVRLWEKMRKMVGITVISGTGVLGWRRGFFQAAEEGS